MQNISYTYFHIKSIISSLTHTKTQLSGNMSFAHTNPRKGL